MGSSITWLDHDAAAGERSMRMLDFFKAQEARDELGVGGMRDAIADQLFPGTSTIQTRLRYMLFIPWVFGEIEGRGVSAAAFPAEARKAEARLLECLVANEPPAVTGIIGRNAGSLLKRMPSAAYWAGLSIWGIRRTEGSLEQHMAEADLRRVQRVRRRRREDEEFHDGDSAGVAWHPEALAMRGPTFPTDATVALTRQESEFLLERWQTACPGSLLTWLALDARSASALPEADTIWRHPSIGDFPKLHKDLIWHAERLDALTRGAAYLYNWLLAGLDNRQQTAEEYEVLLGEWAAEDLPKCAGWNLADYWPLVLSRGHTVTPATQQFIREWQNTCKSDGAALTSSSRACALIRDRERALKRGRSRFDNRAALNQWGGAAGVGELSFRWPIANAYLADWHAGWKSQ